MTVRWKPLMILSGLFLVVALVGVIAITVAMMPTILAGHPQGRPGGPRGRPVPGCRDLLQAGAPGRAPQRAIHEDFAGTVSRLGPAGRRREAGGPAHRVAPATWPRPSSSTRRPRGRGSDLLRDAMDQDLATDSVYWAKEMLNVAPDDLDAHYVLAAESLEERAPNVPEIKRHLEVLEKVKAPAVRRLWIRARLADLAGDDAARAAALAEARALPASDGRARMPVDRFARLRLTALEIRSEAGWQALADPVEAAPRAGQGAGQARGTAAGAGRAAPAAAGADPAVADGALGQAAARGQEGRRRRWSTPSRSTWRPVFQQALADGRQPDLQTYLSYADHLRLRRQPDRCLEVVDRALQDARRRRSARRSSTVLGLHTVAVDMILARTEDAARFDKADAARPGPARLPRAAVPGVRPPVRRLDRPRPLGDGSRADRGRGRPGRAGRPSRSSAAAP